MKRAKDIPLSNSMFYALILNIERKGWQRWSHKQLSDGILSKGAGFESQDSVQN